MSIAREAFIDLLKSLVSDTVEDTKGGGGRVPKYRAKREAKTVKTLANAAGFDLTDQEVSDILMFS